MCHPATHFYFSLSIDLLYRTTYTIVKKEMDRKNTTMPEWFPSLVNKIEKTGEKSTLYKLNDPPITMETNEKTGDIKVEFEEPQPIVYVIQEISGTRHGAPKINIMGAQKYGKFVFCLPEMAQIIFSPGPLIFKLRKVLRNYTANDFLLLTGDPAIIGVACSIVSDITNGKYKLLKWDKQERRYYPIVINLHEKGDIDENNNGTTGSSRI